MTIPVVYKLPVYPGWRMWLWRVFRVRRPLWNVYRMEAAQPFLPGLNSGDGLTFSFTPDRIVKVAENVTWEEAKAL